MDYKEKFRKWEKARFSPPPEPELRPFPPTVVDMVAMRDGVRLYTEIFLPYAYTGANCSNKIPCILIRSPYPYNRPSRSDKRPLSRYLDAGFAVVFQLTRGQGKSEGVFHFFKDEINDGYDCIEWITEQLWCSGNIGMEGSSYLGGTQLLAAKANHPALKCIMPTAFIGNYTKYFPYCNGVPNLLMYLQWHKVADLESCDDLEANYGDVNLLKHPVWGPALRKKPLIDVANGILSGDKLDSWRETISRPMDDECWEDIHFSDEELAKLDIPIFLTDGWYDPTVGPINFFERLEKIRPNKEQYLLVGPWNHAQTFADILHDQDNGDRKMPKNASMDLMGQRVNFFEKFLKYNSSNSVQKNRVRVFITGSHKSDANVWLEMSTFPAPGTKEIFLYLHSQGDAKSFPLGGMLNEFEPTKEPEDIYFYDPDFPTPTESEPLRDRREIEIRGDVLCYTTEPLVHSLTILGEIKLTLYAATDCLDTDWFAQITEVFPDGKSLAFHSSICCLRTRYTNDLKHERLLEPNHVYQFALSLGHAAHQIRAGNQLRLSVFSANYPLCSPNTNTGGRVMTDTGSAIAKQTIYHDHVHPSRLIIPTINLLEFLDECPT